MKILVRNFRKGFSSPGGNCIKARHLLWVLKSLSFLKILFAHAYPGRSLSVQFWKLRWVISGFVFVSILAGDEGSFVKSVRPRQQQREPWISVVLFCQLRAHPATLVGRVCVVCIYARAYVTFSVPAPIYSSLKGILPLAYILLVISLKMCIYLRVEGRKKGEEKWLEITHAQVTVLSGYLCICFI